MKHEGKDTKIIKIAILLYLLIQLSFKGYLSFPQYYYNLNSMENQLTLVSN